MQSTLAKLMESDPHDTFVFAPDSKPTTWADKVIADIARDTASHPAPDAPAVQPQQQGQHQRSGALAGAPTPTVDMMFRAPDADDRPVLLAGPSGSWVKNAVVVFLLALGGAVATASWQHYGDAARQMLPDWMSPFAVTSSPPTERTGLAAPSDTPDVQAQAADQSPPQSAAPAQVQAPAPEAATPAAAAPAADTAQSIQSMAQDLVAMGQQIEQLKANIAELKASQQAMARDVAKTSEAKSAEARPAEAKPAETKPTETKSTEAEPSEAKPAEAKAAEAKAAEIKPSVQRPRPKPPTPPRTAAAPPRRPLQAYPPVQAAAPAPLPQYAPPPPPPQFASPSQSVDQSEAEPVVRPPMPLR